MLIGEIFIALSHNRHEAIPGQSREAHQYPPHTHILTLTSFIETRMCKGWNDFINPRIWFGNIFFFHLPHLSFPNPVFLYNFPYSFKCRIVHLLSFVISLDLDHCSTYQIFWDLYFDIYCIHYTAKIFLFQFDLLIIN